MVIEKHLHWLLVENKTALPLSIFRKQELSFSLSSTSFCSQTLIRVTGELDLWLQKTVALLYRVKHPQTTCHSSQLRKDGCPENSSVQNSKANNSPSCPDLFNIYPRLMQCSSLWSSIPDFAHLIHL